MAELIFNVDDDEQGCPSGQSTPAELAARAKIEPPSGDIFTPYVQKNRSGDWAIDLMISGAHCAGCVAKIEREISALDNVKTTRMNLSTMRLNIAWAGEKSTANQLVTKLENLGFGAKPFHMQLGPLKETSELNALLKALGVAGAALAFIMTLSVPVWSGAEMSEQTRTFMHWVSAAIALPAVAYSGRPFFRSAWSALKNKQTNMDVPISLAVLLACALSIFETIHGNPDTYFDAAVMLLFLLLIGRFLDTQLRLKTGESAQRLAAMQSVEASRIGADGTVTSVPAAMIEPGDILLIASGESVPVDVEILTGISDIDTSIATGETLPVRSGIGDTLYSGMINLGGALTVKALSASSNSFLSEISKLVEAGEQKKSKFVRIADRAARAYVPVVHSLAIMTFVGWIIAGGSLRTASLNAIAVLIITCPCALGLAVPAVQIVASGRLFKKGVLLKSGDALERLAKVDHIVFDKTGTLTLGSLQLDNMDEISEDNLHLAASLARGSNHPIARAIALAAGRGGLAKDVQEVAGQGLKAHLNGKTILLGNSKFVGLPDQSGDTIESYLRIGKQKPVRFALSDRPRMDAIQTISTLQSQGYATELLTGDNAIMARRIAQKLGLEKWAAKVSPQDKLARLEVLKQDGHKTLMIGDGINDAPALAGAYVSAAPSGAADISRAAADIILQGDKLSGLVTALSVSKQAQRRVVENLSLAVIYNMIAVPLAVLGFVNPMIAAAAMSGSSILVTLNALRLKGGDIS